MKSKRSGLRSAPVRSAAIPAQGLSTAPCLAGGGIGVPLMAAALADVLAHRFISTRWRFWRTLSASALRPRIVQAEGGRKHRG